MQKYIWATIKALLLIAFGVFMGWWAVQNDEDETPFKPPTCASETPIPVPCTIKP